METTLVLTIGTLDVRFVLRAAEQVRRDHRQVGGLRERQARVLATNGRLLHTRNPFGHILLHRKCTAPSDSCKWFTRRLSLDATLMGFANYHARKLLSEGNKLQRHTSTTFRRLSCGFSCSFAFCLSATHSAVVSDFG